MIAAMWAGLGTVGMFALFLLALAIWGWVTGRADGSRGAHAAPPEVHHEEYGRVAGQPGKNASDPAGLVGREPEPAPGSQSLTSPPFLPAPTQTPPAGRRDAGRIPPASRRPSGAGSRPGASERDPAAAAPAVAAGRSHDTAEPPRRVWLHPCDCPRCRDNPDGPVMIPADEPDGVHDTAAPAAPDPFSEAYAHVRAIQALTPDEYAAQHLGRQYADDTGSFLASTTGWSQ